MAEDMITYTCAGQRLGQSDQHVGCGQDLTALIAELPADREEHAVRCPRCGTEAKIRKT